MSVTYGAGKCKFPCSCCLVTKADVATFPTSTNRPAYRTVKGMKTILKDIEDGKSTEETHSVYEFQVSPNSLQYYSLLKLLTIVGCLLVPIVGI